MMLGLLAVDSVVSRNGMSLCIRAISQEKCELNVEQEE